MVYLVRHGHDGSKTESEGPDLVRALSETGHTQAVGLVARPRDYPVGRILASPADRCRQTVEPLASHRGLPIEAHPHDHGHLRLVRQDPPPSPPTA